MVEMAEVCSENVEDFPEPEEIYFDNDLNSTTHQLRLMQPSMLLRYGQYHQVAIGQSVTSEVYNDREGVRIACQRG